MEKISLKKVLHAIMVGTRMNLLIPSFFGGLGIRETSGIFLAHMVNDALILLLPIFFIVWAINALILGILGLLTPCNFQIKKMGWSLSS